MKYVDKRYVKSLIPGPIMAKGGGVETEGFEGSCDGFCLFGGLFPIIIR